MRKKPAIKVVKVDDSDDDKKPAAATKEEGDIGNNINVDIVDNFVIFSSPLPEKQGGKKINKPTFQHQTKKCRRKSQERRRPPHLHPFMCQVNMS